MLNVELRQSVGLDLPAEGQTFAADRRVTVALARDRVVDRRRQARDLVTMLSTETAAPATGRTISYVSHEFYRVADGLVAEEWICSDMASLFRQLS